MKLKLLWIAHFVAVSLFIIVAYLFFDTFNRLRFSMSYLFVWIAFVTAFALFFVLPKAKKWRRLQRIYSLLYAVLVVLMLIPTPFVWVFGEVFVPKAYYGSDGKYLMRCDITDFFETNGSSLYIKEGLIERYVAHFKVSPIRYFKVYDEWGVIVISGDCYNWDTEKDVQTTDVYTLNDSLAATYRAQIDRLKRQLGIPLQGQSQ